MVADVHVLHVNINHCCNSPILYWQFGLILLHCRPECRKNPTHTARGFCRSIGACAANQIVKLTMGYYFFSLILGFLTNVSNKNVYLC